MDIRFVLRGVLVYLSLFQKVDLLEELVDFLDTALMAATLERSVEEFVDNLKRELLGNEAGRDGNDVAIVVLTAEMGNLDIPAESAADVGIFIDSHLNTVATAADDDTAGIGAVVDSRTDLMSEIGVVATLGRISTEILGIETEFVEVGDDSLFEFEAGVVAGDGYDLVHVRDNIIFGFWANCL